MVALVAMYISGLGATAPHCGAEPQYTHQQPFAAWLPKRLAYCACAWPDKSSRQRQDCETSAKRADACLTQPTSCDCVHQGDSAAVKACWHTEASARKTKAMAAGAAIMGVSGYVGYRAGGTTGAIVGGVVGGVAGLFVATMMSMDI